MTSKERFKMKDKPDALDIKEYVFMAHNATQDAVEEICDRIDDDAIRLAMKLKFQVVGNTTDSEEIANIVNEELGLENTPDEFDAEKVDAYVRIVTRDAENGKFGGVVCSLMGLSKSLMTYCIKHRKEIYK